MRQRGDVDLDHASLDIVIDFGIRTAGAEACIVHQHVDRDALPAEFLEDARRRGGIGQVGRQHARLDAMRAAEFAA